MTITTQTLMDGARNVVQKFHLDGASEETNATLVDVSALNGFSEGEFTEVKITAVQSSLTGFSATLHWDATANVDALQLLEGDQVRQCYEQFGGLINASGAGKTGDILISTNGLGAGDEGTIVLEMWKR